MEATQITLEDFVKWANSKTLYQTLKENCTLRAEINHKGKNYTRTIWNSETTIGTFPVVEVMYGLYEVLERDGQYVTGRCCRICG